MLTQTRLQELLTYNPNTGKFYRKTTRGSRKSNTETGTINKEYLFTKIDGIRYSLHRLAFLYMLGGFPDKDVDHINGVKSDNKWSNLRTADRKQNIWNTGPRSTNILGIKNVTQLFDTKKYQVVVNGKSYGCFIDLELADLVAQEVRNKLHGEFARHV